ncbi:MULTISPECIES: MHYT domain-containing protein [Cyanophyceae]|uniref:MHYT domain-containing protein n=1 Tax=Cyanophyceae TaxID=3028117 RepID=UPI001682EE0E|nr:MULTISPECIES: MHYT domain-containing protein [Cyanophyceae]MBD1917739.1 response regulator [Phormidium sp. FACHB-77]MBD2032858.1 response regulator [Phormidium sp. FACHB-322]MBD2051605.1 response regulator [Leptolyngbya sp. FACHB-60]
MAYTVVGHYNAGLVCLSFGIAILASYTTLSLGQQILAATGWRQWPWLTGGALAMGTGIWATHFVAMLAFELPLPVNYDLLTTGLSLVYAVLAAGIALGLVSRARFSWLSLSAAGIVMGLSIAWMHYTGMAAMEMPAHLRFRWPLMGLSIAVAVMASIVALGLSLQSRRRPKQGDRWLTRLAVLVLSLGIGGLHYIGMGGTVFLVSSTPIEPAGVWPNLEGRWLALAVGLGAGLILLGILITLRINQRLTQQRLQKEALSQSEHRFRTLIREMGVGALLLNPKAEILISNRAAQQFLLLPEANGAPLVFGQAGIICRENGTPFAPADLPVQQAIAQKAPIGDVIMGVSAAIGNSPRWLLVNADPQFNEVGGIERVVCTCSDITIQKQAEDAVRAVANREKAVIRIVQRMRQTLELETIFAATTQELKQAISCDRAWIYRFNENWSGSVVAEALADPMALSTVTDSTTGESLIERDACSTRQMQNSSFDEGYLLLEDTYLQETQAETFRQDRSYHRVNDIYDEGFDSCYLEFLERWQIRAYVIVPIYAGSQLWGLLGVYAHHQVRSWTRHEVKMVLQVGAQLGTAVQQANLLRKTQQQAQALEIAKRAADAASQAKGDFLASMSHELRTPLNAILGFTQILHDDDGLSDDHRDLIAIVNRSGNHLLGLINNVLSLAKIEANKISLDEAVFDLHYLLQSVDDMLQLKAEAKGIRLEVIQPPPLTYRLWADEGKLRQILINLISNAIKFTALGCVTVRSQLRSSALMLDSGNSKTHWLEITVQDTGVGIDADELSCLFQPFEQTQSGRHSAEGTGLGLSLSNNFAQLMGGTIVVTSLPGKGSTFTLSIPVGAVTTALIEPAKPERSIVHLASNQPHYRILVADDVAESRLLMRHWLEGVGFEVREASQGEEAIELWTNWQPHLICLDMRMPVLDGYGVARHLRQLPDGSATVIVAVTASVFEEQQSDCIAAGCNAVLPKPLQRDQLLEQIGCSLGIIYQYAEVVHADDKTAAVGPHGVNGQSSGKDQRPLTQADFKALAPDWLAQIHQAAQAANDRQVRQLIAQLPAEQKVLAQRLDRLVNDFRLDVIIDLTAVPTAPVPL